MATQARKLAARFRRTGSVFQIVSCTVNPGSREIHDGTNFDTEGMKEQFADSLKDAASVEVEAEYDKGEVMPDGDTPEVIDFKLNGRPWFWIKGGLNVSGVAAPRGQRVRVSGTIWSAGGKDGFGWF